MKNGLPAPLGGQAGEAPPDIGLQEALKRGEGRRDDTPYIARVIFCQMVKGQEMDLTGFGITTSMTDNEHPVLVYDPNEMQVRVEQAPGRNRSNPCIGKKFSAKDYCALANISWDALDAA